MGSRNAVDITLSRESADGPDFGGNTSVQNPSGSAWDLGPVSHTQPQILRYRLTAENSCGAVSADVLINAIANPGLSIEKIEVTQGIQTEQQTVPLVEDKPTVVRVYVRHGLNGFGTNRVPGVTGRVRTRQVGGAWSGWLAPINGTQPPVPTPGASITVVANPDRARTNDTLNFLLPTGRCTGEIDIEAEISVSQYGAQGGVGGIDDTVSQVFLSEWTFLWFTLHRYRFNRRRWLDIRYIRVTWNGATPTAAECEDTIRMSLQRIPTPGATITAVAGVGVQNPPAPHNFDDVEDLVDDFDDQHNCSFFEALTEWLGSDCPVDDGAYWALVTGGASGGKAAGIPSNTYLTPVDDENRAPHELAHSLDQLHIEVACPNGRQASGGDSPDDWPNQGELVDVPFDIDQNTTVTDADGVWDIMTYCGTRWTMPRRWRRLYDFIGG